jgi:hypothetical protein
VESRWKLKTRRKKEGMSTKALDQAREWYTLMWWLYEIDQVLVLATLGLYDRLERYGREAWQFFF